MGWKSPQLCCELALCFAIDWQEEEDKELCAEDFARRFQIESVNVS